MNLQELLADKLSDELLGAGVASDRVDGILGKYDKLCEKSSPQLSFKILLTAYSSVAATRTSSIIQQALDKVNREHPGVQTNVLQRLKLAVDRWNSKISKMSCLLNGQPALSEEEVERYVKLKLPKCLQPAERLESLANIKSRMTGLDVEVK